MLQTRTRHVYKREGWTGARAVYHVVSGIQVNQYFNPLGITLHELCAVHHASLAVLSQKLLKISFSNFAQMFLRLLSPCKRNLNLID